ncbi:hypothetical protein GUJ93_ZPchr0010g7252 [Zizania palustris]|uniref:Uncharacterized protein n=1 Tax=Zizania palustris TaxID=103762 RepID=A0A8J5W7P4_ZIZPA|nr:hypothetical protein GUJ93_ZPchr0010g7252 [Zizania palustris]
MAGPDGRHASAVSPSCHHRVASMPPRRRPLPDVLCARWLRFVVAPGASVRLRIGAEVRWWRGQWPLRRRGAFLAEGSRGESGYRSTFVSSSLFVYVPSCCYMATSSGTEPTA